MNGRYYHAVRSSNNNAAASATNEAPPVPSVLIRPNLPPNGYQDILLGVRLCRPLTPS